MGAGAQIGEISLTIKGDGGVFWKILDQLHFVGFFPFFHKTDRFFPRQFKPFDGRVFFYDLLHLCFDPSQILLGQRFNIKIVIKSISDGRSNGTLGVRIQTFYRLGQNMGCGMAKSAFTAFVIKCEDIQLTVLIEYRPQIHRFSIHFPGTGHAGQSF